MIAPILPKKRGHSGLRRVSCKAVPTLRVEPAKVSEQTVRERQASRLMSKKGSYEDKKLTLRSLVARYYPAVYGFAARLTDDPRDAVALTRHAFNSSRRQLQNIGSQTAIATVLIAAVLRAGLASA